MEDIILNEKNKYNKVYTELMFCVDDLRKMLDTEELEKRSFISKVDTLKDYIEFLDNLEKESKPGNGTIWGCGLVGVGVWEWHTRL